MNRPGRWGVVLVVLVAAALYGSTAAPGLYWDDAGEILAAAEHGAVLHPPGHALPALLGWCASRLAGGGEEGARAVNLLCAFVAAMAAGAGYSVLLRWMPSSARVSTPAAVILSMIVGTSLWRFATSAEVYGWILLLVCGGLMVLPMGRLSRRGDIGAGYVAALGAASHAMLLPVGFIVCAARIAVRGTGRIPAAGRILVGGFLGSSVLLFLPLRGRMTPETSWGQTDSIRGFVDHLLARDFAPELVGRVHRLGESAGGGIGEWLAAIADQGPLPLLALGFISLVAGWGPWGRGVRMALLGIVVTTAVVATQVGGGIVLDAYVMPTAWVLLICGGVGLMTLLVGSPRWLHHGVVILLVAWTSHRFVQSWSERDLSSFEGTRLYAEALVSASPHDSVLLLENSMDYFALVGFQAVHRQRMDLVPVFIPTLSRRWARERLVSRIGSVEFGDLERLADSVQSQGRSVLYGPGDRFRMSRDVLSVRGPLYGWKDMEPLTRRAEMALERFVEGGLGSNDLWYRRRVSIVMGRRAEHESVAGNLASAITDQKVAAEAMPLDGRLHYNLAVLLERASRWEDAVAAYQVALGLDPTRANREGLARSLLGSGQVEAGIHMFRALVDAHGDDAVLRYKLGTALLQAGRFGEAANELRLSVDQAPDQVLAWNNLGLALLAGGGREEARHTWEEALRRFPAHVGLQRNILGLEGE